MAIKTRLDKRAEGNNQFAIVDSISGKILATVEAVSSKVELEINTIEGLHIEKPNGYSSKR
jgi:hypothetical protein